VAAVKPVYKLPASTNLSPYPFRSFFLVLDQLFTRFKKMAANQERTYLMIKPDGVQRGLVGEIIKRFEQKGFKLVAMKFVQVRVHLKP
jgi:hypothetical protein